MASLYAGPGSADPMRPLGPPSGPNSTAPPADPTAPPLPAAAQAPLRRLVAIRQDTNGERAALFGDRWVRTGQRFMAPEGDTLVVSIGTTFVELEQGSVRNLHHLLAPLLPAQWPTAPAAPTARPDSPTTTPPTGAAPSTAAPEPARPSTTLPAPSAASSAAHAPRTERP